MCLKLKKLQPSSMLTQLRCNNSKTKPEPKKVIEIKGDVVSTDLKPEAGQIVTFSLREFTDTPEAEYYLLLGKQKMLFENGELKYQFKKEGNYRAELRCAFRGDDVLVDKEIIEVTNKMKKSTLALLLEN